MSTEELQKRVEQFRAYMVEQRTEATAAERLLAHKQGQLELANAEHVVWERASVVVQDVTTAIQESLRVQVAEIVTLALDIIFDGRYIFDLRFKVAYGRVATSFRLLDKKRAKSFDPMEENGGGIVDVVSFALRLAFWAISANRTNPLFVMDEPFKFVSADLRARVGTFLRAVVERIGAQMILVTHQKFIEECADKVFVVSKVGRVSKVEVKKCRTAQGPPPP